MQGYLIEYSVTNSRNLVSSPAYRLVTIEPRYEEEWLSPPDFFFLHATWNLHQPFLTRTRVSCSRHRCVSPERWCPRLSPARCSQFGKCSLSIDVISAFEAEALGDAFAASVVLRSSSAAISKLPPVITLLGSGIRALVDTGGTIMFDDVPYMSL